MSPRNRPPARGAGKHPAAESRRGMARLCPDGSRSGRPPPRAAGTGRTGPFRNTGVPDVVARCDGLLDRGPGPSREATRVDGVSRFASTIRVPRVASAESGDQTTKDTFTGDQSWIREMRGELSSVLLVLSSLAWRCRYGAEWICRCTSEAPPRPRTGDRVPLINLKRLRARA